MNSFIYKLSLSLYECQLEKFNNLKKKKRKAEKKTNFKQ